jgi:glutamate-1-semialdehyde 2,1-aminomutase
MTKFDASLALQQRFHAVIPGGSHTYAKGDDQFPEFMPPYIVRGKGCRVWDADGNEFIEYGSGLRAVALGHAFPSVVEAACKQMQLGSNFIRPSVIELEVAEQLLSFISGAEMVKFAKNGSDANNAALRLARAYTGRDLVAICADHPFYSVDDWFIGTTAMNAGIPEATRELTLKFRYNDLNSLAQLFAEHPGAIAAVFMEPEKDKEPTHGFLHEAQRLCRQHGAVFILDEMITGFRWHLGGGQGYHGIEPDLSCFGKALANGFSVSALVGKREIMQLGGLHHDKSKVFLVSTTHGAETHALAAAREVMNVYRREPVIETLWARGERLAAGFRKSAAELELQDQLGVFGKPCCLVYGTKDLDKQPSQGFRTLFIQECMKRGVLASSLVVSYSHSERDIDQTLEAMHEAMVVYKKALQEGLDKYLVGRPVKPAIREKN